MNTSMIYVTYIFDLIFYLHGVHLLIYEVCKLFFSSIYQSSVHLIHIMINPIWARY